MVNGSGTFKIGGELAVTRLGFGAMRITGSESSWGYPADRDAVISLLRELPELGVDFIDTAESYGPYVSEELIHQALHPYPGITVTTKVGIARTGPGGWLPLGRPEFIRQGCEMSLRRLGLESLPLLQLHRIDPAVERDEQFGVLKSLQDEGKVRHIGLSEVSVEEIEAAQAVFQVATVQNLYNLANRNAEDVLDYCEAHSIGFIPWFPLASGELARDGGPLADAVAQHHATPGQVALAWLLRRSPVMLPIPGTTSVAHLRENVAAGRLELSDAEFDSLDRASRAAA